MKNVFHIAKRELQTWFNSPVAYVVLGVFLLASGWLFFFFSGLFIQGKASMRSFFSMAPILFMFVTPAVTMRLLAEERKTGTLEMLMTLPIREWEIAVGKWLAAVLMLGVGLLFTLAYPISLAALIGEGQHFDWGPVMGGYLGLLFLASAFVAVGLWASAISKNQIVGFIVALGLCFVLWVLDRATMVLPAAIAYPVSYLSVTYHFENISRGVVDTRDVLYFAGVTIVGLLATNGALERVRQTTVAQRTNAGMLRLIVVGIVVLLNVLSVSWFGRLDLTRDHAFTLSPVTREMMRNLSSPVKVTAYFSENLPPPFSDNARYVKDLLEEYRAASDGEVSFEFIDPQSQETAEDKEKKKDVKRDIFGRQVRDKTSVETELEGLGIQPVEVRVFEEDQAQTKRAYMALAIRFGEEKEAIPVIQDVSTLEYDMTTIIRRLTRKKQPVVGVVQGHGEPTVEEGLAKLSQVLKDNYEVRPITIGTGADAKVPDDVDALLIIGPNQPYAEEEQKAIDDYLMRGRAAAFFLDRVQVDLKTFQPTPVTHNLDSLVSAYGIELGGQLVGDVSSGELQVPMQGKSIMGMQIMSRVRYPYVIHVKELVGESALTKGLGDMFLPFAAALYPKTVAGLEVSPLAKSTQKSWLEDGTAENIDPRRDWQSATVSFTGPYNLVVQAIGKLPSAKTEGKASETDARVVVVGTSGFLGEQVLSPQNAALFMNIVDWLSLDRGLLEMRTRGLSDAAFDANMSDASRTAAKFGNVIGAPLLLVLYGLIRRTLREAKRKKLQT